MLALAPPHGVALRSTPALLVDHAGAESNTCVGLARLGLRTAWVSRLGADAAGDRILAAIREEGVDVQWVERDAQRSTGLMLKDPDAGVRYYRRDSAASAMGSSLLDPVPVADARAVLVTGVTALISADAHAAGLALLDRARGLRVVDPNLRAGLWGSGRRAALVRPFVERCDLLLAGDAELGEIVGAGGAGGRRERAREARAQRSRGSPRHSVRAKSSSAAPAAIGVLADGAWYRARHPARRGRRSDRRGRRVQCRLHRHSAPRRQRRRGDARRRGLRGCRDDRDQRYGGLP